jgi:hypothetical protein
MAQRHNAPRHIVRHRQALVRVPLVGDLHQLLVPRKQPQRRCVGHAAKIAFAVVPAGASSKTSCRMYDSSAAFAATGRSSAPLSRESGRPGTKSKSSRLLELPDHSDPYPLATNGTVQVMAPSGTLSSNVPFRVLP